MGDIKDARLLELKLKSPSRESGRVWIGLVVMGMELVGEILRRLEGVGSIFGSEWSCYACSYRKSSHTMSEQFARI